VSSFRGEQYNAVEHYDYDAYGNLLHATGSTPNNYFFAGEQFDPDLGLYYNRARYLNTSTGRFWDMDSYEGEKVTTNHRSPSINIFTPPAIRSIS
jgi:RHS repeat-associated protein